jgi:glycosyltransferase involved in cell wall biosynthesis
VQLELTQMAQYADACSPASTILVEHDITFDLQQQLLANSPEGGAARWELEQQLLKWQRFERDAWRRVDCVVTMSQKDKEIVSGAKVSACLPNGVDADRFQPCDQAPDHGRLLFIGSFAHLPNILGLEFFLREVWPLLGAKYRLHVIAGSRHEYYLDLHCARASIDVAQSGIEVEGFVSDVRDAYRRAELVIAPLIASAGTNIKVLEAMAMGRVVVSTPAGVNGLDVTPGEDVVVITSATEMAERIQYLSAYSEHRARIEERARRTAVEKYDWRSIARKQSALYAELERKQTPARSQL